MSVVINLINGTQIICLSSLFVPTLLVEIEVYGAIDISLTCMSSPIDYVVNGNLDNTLEMKRKITKFRDMNLISKKIYDKIRNVYYENAALNEAFNH